MQLHTKLGFYEYSVSWQGIPAATCTISVIQTEHSYVVHLSARTYSNIDPFFRLRLSTTSTLSKSTLKPVETTIESELNSRYEETAIAFSPDLKTVSAYRTRGAGEQNQARISFKPENFTLDPISAVFFARALPWSIGDHHTFDIFTGSARYHLGLRALRSEVTTHNGVEREAIVLEPQLRDLTASRPESNFRGGLIYLSKDPQRDILKFSGLVENCTLAGSLNL